MPKVSIVIPVYNVAPYLRQCLGSVVNQTMRDIEAVCVDDGSTDGSAAILAEYAARDPRIKVLTREHTNAGAARNAGMAVATGEYCLFLDADDLFSCVMVESLYSAAVKFSADIAKCGMVRFDGETTPPALPTETCNDFTVVEKPAVATNPYHEHMGWAWDKLISRKFIEDNELRFQEQDALNDFAFTMSACCLASRLTLTSAILVAHRNRPDSIESTRDRAPRCFARALKRHHETLADKDVWKTNGELLRNFSNYCLRLAFWSLDTTKTSQAVAEVYEELQHLLPDLGIPVDDPVYLGEYPHWFRRYRKIMDGMDLIAFLRSESYDLWREKEALRVQVAGLEKVRSELGDKLHDIQSSAAAREATFRKTLARGREAFSALKKGFIYQLGMKVSKSLPFLVTRMKGYSLAEPEFPAIPAMPGIDYPRRFVSKSVLGPLLPTAAEAAQAKPALQTPQDRTIRNVPHAACTGCGACMNRCPKDAISMKLDSEGFLHPVVDAARCINCALCRQACPVEHPKNLYPTPPAYAVWAADDVRLQSSSGGMFSMLADHVLSHGGAVCGAVYAPDFMSVHHAWAESAEALGALRGSKYVQSDTGMSYRRAKELLDAGRTVLYTGCPCQIAGLYGYLGPRIYPNLITADLICHGSNSVTAYQSFLHEFAGGKPIAKVDFRDKKYFTWSTPTVIYYQDKTVKKAAWNESRWYDGFLGGVINRQNCYSCRYACAERIADITLGDCWKVHEIDPAYDDRRGTSLVLVNSPKGREVFDIVTKGAKLNVEVPLERVRKSNGQLNHPTAAARNRRFFFSHLPKLGYHKSLWYGLGRRWDVGIVGWWFASNYGSSLTYYALGTILEDLGHPVIFIPIAKPDGTPFEPEIRQTVDFVAKYFKIATERDYRHMPEYNRFCDAFLVGSDQMWTASTTNLVGYSFFLDFVAKEHKKVAFSVSFGKSAFNGTAQQIATVRDFLEQFDAISTRELTGVEICRDQFGLEVQQVFDPVFLCPHERYDRLTTDESPRRKPYLMCYILDPSPAKEAAARAIAAHENLDVVTILGIKEYAKAKDQWHVGETLAGVTTEGFVNHIRHCSYLLTDSHHGTCFGIIYHKPYMALVNAARGRTRFDTVAKCLGLENRLVDDPLTIVGNDRIYAPIDYAAVEDRLKGLKDYALNWLLTALEKPIVPSVDTENTKREQARRLWN